MQYKNKSQDTLNHISLHDCIIRYAEWNDNNLVFYLEWIDVLKTHPLNNTGKSKYTSKASLVFNDAFEVSCFYYDFTKAIEKKKKENRKTYMMPVDDAEIVKTNIIEHCKNIEISEDEGHIENGEKIWNCKCQDDSEFTIRYRTMFVCFNDLERDAWFEQVKD